MAIPALLSKPYIILPRKTKAQKNGTHKNRMVVPRVGFLFRPADETAKGCLCRLSR
jgi:hypothetical protein